MQPVTHCEARIGALIEGLCRGEAGAADELFALVYEELKHLAHRQRHRWQGNHTMHTTALVHEVYVKLSGQQSPKANSPAHFQALAARAMRQVLCNYARDQRAAKRGGDAQAQPLDQLVGEPGQAAAEEPHSARLLALDAALDKLGRLHPRASRVVECRFFGGSGVEDCAAALQISPRSVKRDWAFAQAWLHQELEGTG